MKLNKVLVQILFSAILLNSVIEASKSLRKVKTSSKTNPVCPKVFGKGETASADITSADVYPQDSQNENAKNNAKLQGASARKLFSVVGAATATKKVLGDVAKNFGKFLKDNAAAKTVLIMKFDPKKSVARQATENGTWGHFSVVMNEIPEFAKLTEEEKRAEFYMNALAEISAAQNPVPSSILGMLGILGDCGAAYMDIVGRRRDGTPETTPVKEALDTFFGKETQTTAVDYFNKYCPDKYHDELAGENNTKQKERKTCGDNAKTNLTPRKGIMDLGAAMDEANHITEHTLPALAWPWQTVPEKLPKYCPDEPWAGHFSGSLYELILMLELFDRANPSTPEVASPEKKKIYAGLASSFLVSTGMHTAVELNYVVKNYLGTPIAKEDLLKKDKNCDGATEYIKKIIDDISAAGKKRSKKNIKK